MSMEDFFIYVLIAVIVVAILYHRKKVTSKLTSDGKIIKRKNDFMEKAEYFTLTLNDKTRVAEEIQRISYFTTKVLGQ